MPVFIWRKAGAVLLTKAAKYIVPAIIAAAGAVAGAVAGFFAGKRRKRKKGDLP